MDALRPHLFDLKKSFIYSLEEFYRGRATVPFAFGDHVLDAERRELYRAGVRVALEPQVFDLLLYLVENRTRVISKDDLIEHIWRGRAVSNSALGARLNSARSAVGDSGAAQRIIRTLPRKGVRFVAEVEEHTTAPQVTIMVAPPPRLAQKPSVAVMRFRNLSSDPEQAYFSEGIVDEIVTALSRIRWLSVFSYNSIPPDEARQGKVSQVGRDFGAQYLLEGSVRKLRQRLRITGRLLDAQTGRHVWADRFEGSIKAVFELQDRVAAGVAGVIEPALQAAEAVRSSGLATDDMTAYDLYLRAHALYLSGAKRVSEALGLLEKAVARDPHFAPALAWAGTCCFRLVSDGRSSDPTADRLRSVAFARRALEVGGDDPGILANAAQALAFFGQDIDAMAALADRALTLNPNFARGWFCSGAIHLWAGQIEVAIEHANTALRLSSWNRVAPSLGLIGMAHFLGQRFDKAISTLLLAIEEDPSYPQPYRYLAASYAHLGRLGQARAVIERLRAAAPLVVPDPSYLRNPEHRQLYLSGVLLAIGHKASVLSAYTGS